MRYINIYLPREAEVDFAALIEVVAERGLKVTFRDTLKAYPGSLRWHLKKGSRAGILEVTFWYQERRAWFSVQSRRDAPWIDEQISRLSKDLQRRFAST